MSVFLTFLRIPEAPAPTRELLRRRLKNLTGHYPKKTITMALTAIYSDLTACDAAIVGRCAGVDERECAAQLAWLLETLGWNAGPNTAEWHAREIVANIRLEDQGSWSGLADAVAEMLIGDGSALTACSVDESLGEPSPENRLRDVTDIILEGGAFSEAH